MEFYVVFWPHYVKCNHFDSVFCSFNLINASIGHQKPNLVKGRVHEKWIQTKTSKLRNTILLFFLLECRALTCPYSWAVRTILQKNEQRDLRVDEGPTCLAWHRLA